MQITEDQIKRSKNRRIPGTGGDPTPISKRTTKRMWSTPPGKGHRKSSSTIMIPYSSSPWPGTSITATRYHTYSTSTGGSRTGNLCLAWAGPVSIALFYYT